MAHAGSAPPSGASRSPAAGWAAGASWESFHQAFRFVDYVVALAVVAGAVWLGRTFLAGDAGRRTRPLEGQ